MRKITKEACKAFYNKIEYKKSNTQVEVENGVATLYLHYNKIAVLDENNRLSICDGGYNSRTTRERLNGLENSFFYVYVKMHKGSLYLNNKSWDGKWTEIYDR